MSDCTLLFLILADLLLRSVVNITHGAIWRQAASLARKRPVLSPLPRLRGLRRQSALVAESGRFGPPHKRPPSACPPCHEAHVACSRVQERPFECNRGGVTPAR